MVPVLKTTNFGYPPTTSNCEYSKCDDNLGLPQISWQFCICPLHIQWCNGEKAIFFGVLHLSFRKEGNSRTFSTRPFWSTVIHSDLSNSFRSFARSNVLTGTHEGTVDTPYLLEHIHGQSLSLGRRHSQGTELQGEATLESLSRYHFQRLRGKMAFTNHLRNRKWAEGKSRIQK